jgi:hypothetical protein
LSENIFDEIRGLGVEFNKDEQRVAELQDALWRVKRQKEGLEEMGEDTTLHDIGIERLEGQLEAALAKIK